MRTGKIDVVSSSSVVATPEDATFIIIYLLSSDGLVYGKKNDGSIFPIGESSNAPYKKYIANLTQAGVAAPDAIILENTLSAIPIWTRDDVGVYTLTLAGEFPDASKVTVSVGSNRLINVGVDVKAIDVFTQVSSPDNIGLGTFYNGDPVASAFSDNQMDNLLIEIRVYN